MTILRNSRELPRGSALPTTNRGIIFHGDYGLMDYSIADSRYKVATNAGNVPIPSYTESSFTGSATATHVSSFMFYPKLHIFSATATTTSTGGVLKHTIVDVETGASSVQTDATFSSGSHVEFTKVSDTKYIGTYDVLVPTDTTQNNTIYVEVVASATAPYFTATTLADPDSNAVKSAYVSKGTKLFRVAGRRRLSDSPTRTMQALVFSGATVTATPLERLPTANYLFAYAEVGDHIYTFGGEPSALRASVHKYSIADNTWTQLADMPFDFKSSSSYGGRACVLEGKILIFSSDNPGANMLFDPVTEKYHFVPPLPSGTSIQACIAESNRVFAIDSKNSKIFTFTSTDSCPS